MSEREILFRGQTRRKGEKVRISGEPVDSNWVYGGIFPGEGDFSIIYQAKPKIEKFTVYSDTVGQFTGLTDKNGTRLFEGDIVKITGFHTTAIAAVKYGSPSEQSTSWGWYFEDNDGHAYFLMSKAFCKDYNAIIIGNIHDSPELLKGD